MATLSYIDIYELIGDEELAEFGGLCAALALARVQGNESEAAELSRRICELGQSLSTRLRHE